MLDHSTLKHGYSAIDFQDFNTLNQAVSAAKQFFLESTEVKKQFMRAGRKAGYHILRSKELFIFPPSNTKEQLPDYLNPCLELFSTLHKIATIYLDSISAHMQWPPSLLHELIQDVENPLSARRLFYYKNITDESISTTPHQDIGLITVIPPSSHPGLEVYDFSGEGSWIPVEVKHPNQVILLIGQTLSQLSNYTLLASAHRIRSVGKDRLSIVYELSPRPDAILQSSNFENKITGQFYKPFSISTSDYYREQRRKHPSANFDDL